MSFALVVIFKTTIILAVASLMTMGLRRASASVRHAVWAVALSAVLVLPMASTVLPVVELPVLPETSQTEVLSGPRFRISDLWHNRSDAQAGNPRSVVRNSLVPPPAPATPWYWQRWLVAGWAVGVVAVLLRLLLGSLAVRRLGKHAEIVDDSHLQDFLDALKAKLRISMRVTLKVVNQPVPPMTWGLFRHVILLPSSATAWTSERQKLVLAHELAHVKRHDGVLQVLAQAACSLYWFNPLAWFAARQLRIERECACDDHVLKLGAVADDYADHLLQVARAVNVGGGLSIATIAMAHPSQLETRILSILDARKKRHSVPRTAAALSIASVALLMLTTSTIRLTAKPGAPPVIAPFSPLALFPDLDFDGFPDPIPGPAVIQGVVIQLGTNAPLRNVRVSFTPVEGQRGASLHSRYDVETRPDGTFEMADLPPGQYRMSLVHEDFVRLHSMAEPLHVTVGDGRPVDDIRLHMVPGPAISGRVVDETGNLASQALVELLRMENRDGRRGLYPANTTVVTDEHGEYRFFGLEAGEYYVRTSSRKGAAEATSVYYPGVTDSQYAMPIAVRAGADITGIDLSLPKGKHHSVRLKVAIAPPAPQHPELSFYVNPKGRAGSVVAGPGMRFSRAADNTWISPLLAPGSYEIEVYLRDPDPIRWARTSVDIKDADVDAGTLVVGPGAWIMGRVSAIESLPVALRKNQLFVVLRPLDGSMFLLPSTRVSESGTFVLPRVPERKFKVDLIGLPRDVYLASTRYGGKEAGENGFAVTGEPDRQLELSLAASGGAVAGVVRNDKDQPMPGSQIVLVPANRDNAGIFKTASADQFGAFSIGGITPGEYSVLAWPAPQAATSLDSPYLKSVEKEIARIVVKSGFTNTINIRALPPPN